MTDTRSELMQKDLAEWPDYLRPDDLSESGVLLWRRALTDEEIDQVALRLVPLIDDLHLPAEDADADG